MRSATFLILALACNSPRAAPTPPVQSVRVETAPPATTPTVGAAPSVATPAPIPSSVPCESDKDCAIDGARASCVAKDAKDKASWVCETAGAYCGCDGASHGCTRRVPEKTSCKTDEECGIQSVGEFEIPVKLAKPRAQKIKPCGPSHVPKCVESACTIAVYKC
jgi:hypothetical protein